MHLIKSEGNALGQFNKVDYSIALIVSLPVLLEVLSIPDFVSNGNLMTKSSKTRREFMKMYIPIVSVTWSNSCQTGVPSGSKS